MSLAIREYRPGKKTDSSKDFFNSALLLQTQQKTSGVMSRTALIIIDMQEFFRPMTTNALPNIVKLARFFQEAGNSGAAAPIILTQHGHPEEDFHPASTNQLVRRWGKKGSVKVGTAEWQIQAEIAPLRTPGIEVIPKNTYDAFLNTNLEEVLRSRGIERVLITGTMTDCCVETTARNCFCKGFETWVIRDATGTGSQAQQKAGIGTWEWAFGEAPTADEAIVMLKEEGAGAGKT